VPRDCLPDVITDRALLFERRVDHASSVFLFAHSKTDRLNDCSSMTHEAIQKYIGDHSLVVSQRDHRMPSLQSLYASSGKKNSSSKRAAASIKKAQS
jgi:hypothetical protein